MPTIHRERGFEVVIHTHDHTPPHVHVKYGSELVLINIGNETQPPTVRKIVEMRKPNVRRALGIVERNQQPFLAAWEKYHDT